MNEIENVEGELLPATIDSARTLALIANETPEIILARAHKAAVALKDVVDHKAKPVKMNGETYLEFEDWQTLANFYNISAKVTSTTFVQYGNAQGFEAKADAIDKLSGRVLSSAESMCLNDEEKWSTRAKYEYQNNQRVKTGEVAVPLFQLRSMAQTRACAKALRNVLAWVVVLAGYKATPAEEMDGVVAANGATAAPAPKAQPPQRKSETAGAVVKVLKGLIADHKPPTGKGPHAFYIEGEWAKTFDDDIADCLIAHKAAEEEVEATCVVETKGAYTNNMIKEVALLAK